MGYPQFMGITLWRKWNFLISKSWNQMEQDGVRWKKIETIPPCQSGVADSARAIVSQGFSIPRTYNVKAAPRPRTRWGVLPSKKKLSLLHQGGRGHAGSQIGSCLPYKWPTDQKCSTQTCGPCKCICGQPWGIPPASHQLVSTLHPSCGWKCSENPFALSTRFRAPLDGAKMGVSSTGMKIDHGRLGWIGKKESQKNGHVLSGIKTINVQERAYRYIHIYVYIHIH